MDIDEISGSTSFIRLRSLHSDVYSELAGLNLVSDESFRCQTATTTPSSILSSDTSSLPPPDSKKPKFSTSQVVAFDSEVKCCSTEVGDHLNDRLQEDNGSVHSEVAQVQQPDVSRTVFVGNIDFRATAGSIRKFFKKFGNVKTVFIVRKHGTRSHKRVAFVKFVKMESAKRAIEASEEEATMHKRLLRIFPANEKKMHSLSEKECHVEDTMENSEVVDEHLVELNDDAMLLIFKYLNLEDLFNADKVCERWRNLVAATWASKQTLDLRNCFSPFGPNRFTSWHLKKILTHCGHNLKSIDLSDAIVLLDCNSIRRIATMCPNLEELDFSGLAMEKGLMETLGNGCEKLQKIVCRHTDNLSEKELWWLVNKCQNLKYLDVSNNMRITAQCFRRCGPNLKVLKLDYCPKIGVAGFTEIAKSCPELAELHLKDSGGLTNRCLKLICKSCVKITKLDLGGFLANVDVGGLCHIGELKHLEELYLSENKMVVDEVLIAVSAGCKQLRVLDLFACSNSISDPGVMSLVTCSKLVELNISYLDNLTDDCLVQLSMSCPLEELTVRGCQAISDAGFQSVVNLCPRLKCLDVSGAKCITIDLVVAANNVVANRDNGIKLELVIGGTLAVTKAKMEYHPLLDVSLFNYCEEKFMPSYDMYDYECYDDDSFQDYYSEYDQFGYDEDAWQYDLDDPVMEMEDEWLS